MGRKAEAVVREEIRSGIRNSDAESIAAVIRFTPASICTMMDSDMTMALSTSRPREMMSEASDIWSIPMSNRDMTYMAMIIAMGTRLATTRPVRIPR